MNEDNNNNSLMSEKKYFNLINSILDMIVELDLDFIITFINPQVYDVLGYSPEELIGKKAIDFIHPDDVSKIVESMKKGIKTREIITDNFRIGHKKGYYIPVSTKGRIVDYENQTKIVAVFRDITEEKEAERRLKESEEKFRKISEQSLVGICIIQDDLMKYVNQQYAENSGYTVDEIMNWKSGEFIKIIHPEDRKMVLEQSRKKQGGLDDVINQYQFRAVKKSGEMFWVEIISNTIIFEGKNAVLISILDITETKLAEQKLKESEKILKDFVHNGTDSISIWDENLNLIEINDVAVDPWASPNNPKKGIPMSDLVPLIKNTDRYEKYLEVAKSGKPVSFVKVKIPPKVGERYFNIKAFKVGKGLGIIGTEITDHIRFEQELKESEEKYREAYNRAELYKDLFYHDISNILSNIKLSVDISESYLNEPGKEREIKDLYELLKGQFERGKKLISNVRKLSNLEDLEKSLKSVNVIKTLEETVTSFKNSLSTKNINISINLCEEKILIRANEFLIEIFDNLLFNAVNYNDNPKTEILIKISRESKEKINYIKFEFIDNGIGISDKRKEIIFQKGFDKEKGSKGMGFGLTLVKKIIENYDGYIWAEDAVKGDFSQGTNFVFLIPEAEK